MMRHSTLDMRLSLLDIKLAPNNRPPQSTTVIRMHIQPGDGLRRSQHDGQLQLCVPLVSMICPANVNLSTMAAQSRGSVNVFVQEENGSLEAIAMAERSS